MRFKQEDQNEDNKQQYSTNFCTMICIYGINGVIINGVFGILLLVTVYNPDSYNNKQEQCELLISWAQFTGMMMSAITFINILVFINTIFAILNYNTAVEIQRKLPSYLNVFLVLCIAGCLLWLLLLVLENNQKISKCGELWELAQVYGWVIIGLLILYCSISCIAWTWVKVNFQPDNFRGSMNSI